MDSLGRPLQSPKARWCTDSSENLTGCGKRRGCTGSQQSASVKAQTLVSSRFQAAHHSTVPPSVGAHLAGRLFTDAAVSMLLVIVASYACSETSQGLEQYTVYIYIYVCRQQQQC